MTIVKESSGDSNPVLVPVIGVSGAGKSSVAQSLAQHLGYQYLDADDFHSPEARAHMASGKPLTDAMREPWIASICDHLRKLSARGESAVLAFSGLKKFHREPLRHCGFKLLFLFLDGDKETIAERMSARSGHFMPPSLLDSQFDSLERPDWEPDVYRLDISDSLSQVVQEAIQAVEKNCGR